MALQFRSTMFVLLAAIMLSFSFTGAQECACSGFIEAQGVLGRNTGTQWSSVALQVLEEVNNNPDTALLVPPIARNLALFSSCMYDTYCILSRDCYPVLARSRDIGAPRNLSEDEISNQVSFAAFTGIEQIFGKVFPQARRQLRHDGLRQRDVAGSIGNKVCRATITARIDDGSDQSVEFEPPRQTNGDSKISFDAQCSKFVDADGWQPLCIPPPQPDAQLPTYPQSGSTVQSISVRQQILDKNSSRSLSIVRQTSGDSGNRLPSLAAAAEDAPTCNPQDFSTPEYGVTVDPFHPGTRRLALNLRAPPQAGSRRFDKEFNEVLEISGKLDDKGKAIAEFWDDNPFRTQPPGQWWRISLEAAVANKISLRNTLALQMTMGMAQLDAAIAAWTTKFDENLVRPITVIQCNKMGKTLTAWSRPYEGVRTFMQKAGMTWRPYLETPPFPGYVSGHSTYGAAGAEVLKSFFGEKYVGPNCFRRERGESEVEPRIRRGRPGFRRGFTDIANRGPSTPGFSPASTVKLCWNTFTEASDENGFSRLLGGVHIKADNVFGLTLGRRVGVAVARRARRFTLIAEGGGEQP